MDPATIASLASSAGSFLSGVGGIASAFGGGGGTSMSDAVKMMRYQAKVSREDIPLRVKAYKEAGIHPLYGMGGQQYQPQAVSIGGDDGGFDLRSMGQGISRAAGALETVSERAFNQTSQKLQLERMSLENDLLRYQITNIARPQSPALPSALGSPMSGQGDSHLIGFEHGQSPDVGVAISRDGSPAVIPSSAIKNRIEDMIIPEAQWYARQLFSDSPDGYAWNAITGQLVPIGSKTFTGQMARGYRRAKSYLKRYASWKLGRR